jgi:hypothetical protein
VRNTLSVTRHTPDQSRRVFAFAAGTVLMCDWLPPVFIAEITARAFLQADANKRRTLSRQDIVRALARSDQFDFLIDIVPREEPLGAGGSASGEQAGAKRKRGDTDEGKVRSFRPAFR